MKKLQSALLATALAAGLLVAAKSAAAPADVLKPGVAPWLTTNIGNLQVERYGQGEPALILFSGLSMGTWTWRSVIDAFAGTHAIYAVTVMGFDGTPVSPPPYLDPADAAVLRLIKDERLSKPVLIGHSLGGHVGLRLVEEHSDLFGGAILIDATPYFPPLQPGQTLEQRAQNIAMLADGIRSAPDWIYEAQTRSTVAGMVSDPQQVDNVTQHSLHSDRGVLAGATSEMSNEDLRPGLARIAVPVLVIAPVSAQAPYMNDQLRALTPDQLTATVRDYYASQYVGAKTVRVQTIANSKHFVMLDQPAALNAAIKTFLASL